MARNKFSGLDRLNRSLARLPIEAEAAIRIAMEKSAEEIVALMKNLVPEGDGDLKDSIGWTFSKNPPKGSIAVGTIGGSSGENLRITIYAGNDRAFYARQVEFGTQAHTVTSKSGKTLVGSDGTVYGKSVNHPGAQAKAFFLPAFRALRKKTRGRISRAVNASARKVARGG